MNRTCFPFRCQRFSNVNRRAGKPAPQPCLSRAALVCTLASKVMYRHDKAWRIGHPFSPIVGVLKGRKPAIFLDLLFLPIYLLLIYKAFTFFDIWHRTYDYWTLA